MTTPQTMGRLIWRLKEKLRVAEECCKRLRDNARDEGYDDGFRDAIKEILTEITGE